MANFTSIGYAAINLDQVEQVRACWKFAQTTSSKKAAGLVTMVSGKRHWVDEVDMEKLLARMGFSEPKDVWVDMLALIDKNPVR